MPLRHKKKIFSWFSMMVLSLLDSLVLERFRSMLLIASTYILYLSKTGIDWSHTSRKEDSGFPISIIDLELQPEIS